MSTVKLDQGLDIIRDNFASENLPPRSEWPELLFDLSHLQYPAQLNCAQELLSKVALHPDKAALIGADATLSYAQLQAQVNQISHVLRDQMQLIPGNRVLLRGANNPMLVACILAVWQVGCIAVPSMPMLRSRELGVMLEQAQISAALCSVDLKDELLSAQEQHPVLQKIIYYGALDQNSKDGGLEELLAKKSTEFTTFATSVEDVCLIGFTSGTTGKPKATVHFHRDVMAICDCFPVSTLRSNADDIFIGTPPLAFTFGLGGLALFPLRVGASAVLLEKYSPETLLQAIQNYRASICFTAPTFYRHMAVLAHQFDLSSLRKTVSAGEALPIATRAAWQQATGLRMIDGIGATEMLHIFISAADDEVRPGATGKPIPGYQACILDDDGQPVAAGVVGRLAVKGPTGCRYLADPRQANYVCNGWNVTGDAYEMDDDGYFWYRARTDDMIISAGYNIAAPEVEEVLLQHPAVAECAVIGCADEERGQIVKAYIVLCPEFKGDAKSDANMVAGLQSYVKEIIAPYKYPRAIEFKDSLPRTETGKLQRFKLRS
ncbi:AMP-binding protein [Solimicrobium silvestre]|uniref:Acyl-coenzyme A synthetase/AMP-(Fatty) acid ligase n=1 Tax=Solimicrobium silvestre TaxID=2099400 RepID=A0A2S9GVM0_9BURK|nr:AMP-binding protein [Solimicrobium silvestre]PRC91760.1 Acyl-coenzyme A synthetase/AMP-(fatty) acid ligase [Solimicrobium silvestre]